MVGGFVLLWVCLGLGSGMGAWLLLMLLLLFSSLYCCCCCCFVVLLRLMSLLLLLLLPLLLLLFSPYLVVLSWPVVANQAARPQQQVQCVRTSKFRTTRELRSFWSSAI